MSVPKYYCNICKTRFISEDYFVRHYWKCRNIGKSKTINNLNYNASITENSDHIRPIKSICASTDVKMNSDKTVNESEESGLVIKSGYIDARNENLSKHLNSKGEKCLANEPKSPILNHPQAILISYSEAKQISNLRLKESYVKLERINLSKYLNISPKKNPVMNSNLEESSRPIGFVNKKILLVMFIGLMNLENEVGRCISESFSFLPDIVEENDDEQLRQSLSFGVMKSRVLDGSYDYLYQFQEDLYAVLDRAQNSSFNSSISKDSVRLKEEYIKIRNKLWDEKRLDQLLKNNFLNETVRHVIVNNNVKPQQRSHLKETSKPQNDLELFNIENAQPLKSTCVIKDTAEDCDKIISARIPKAMPTKMGYQLNLLPFPHLKPAITFTVVKEMPLIPSESLRQTKAISVDCLDSNQSITSAKLNICNYSTPENQQLDLTAPSSPYIIQSTKIVTADNPRDTKAKAAESVDANHANLSAKFDL